MREHLSDLQRFITPLIRLQKRRRKKGGKIETIFSSMNLKPDKHTHILNSEEADTLKLPFLKTRISSQAYTISSYSHKITQNTNPSIPKHIRKEFFYSRLIEKVKISMFNLYSLVEPTKKVPKALTSILSCFKQYLYGVFLSKKIKYKRPPPELANDKSQQQNKENTNHFDNDIKYNTYTAEQSVQNSFMSYISDLVTINWLSLGSLFIQEAFAHNLYVRNYHNIRSTLGTASEVYSYYSWMKDNLVLRPQGVENTFLATKGRGANKDTKFIYTMFAGVTISASAKVILPILGLSYPVLISFSSIAACYTYKRPVANFLSATTLPLVNISYQYYVASHALAIREWWNQPSSIDLQDFGNKAYYFSNNAFYAHVEVVTHKVIPLILTQLDLMPEDMTSVGDVLHHKHTKATATFMGEAITKEILREYYIPEFIIGKTADSLRESIL